MQTRRSGKKGLIVVAAVIGLLFALGLRPWPRRRPKKLK